MILNQLSGQKALVTYGRTSLLEDNEDVNYTIYFFYFALQVMIYFTVLTTLMYTGIKYLMLRGIQIICIALLLMALL
jgi:hypothetical protein